MQNLLFKHREAANVTLEKKRELEADKVVVDSLDVRVTSLEVDLNDMASDISKVNTRVQFVRNETEEKAKRAKNLIIRGAPEVSAVDDKSLVAQILKDIGYEQVEFDSITRLGSKPNQNVTAPPATA